MNDPDVNVKRKNWTENLPKYDKDKFVFLDKSDINTNLTKIYGRVAGGNRCVDRTPLNTPENTTILSSVRLNGETAYTTYQDGTTKGKFIDYLKNVLAPTLEPVQYLLRIIRIKAKVTI